MDGDHIVNVTLERDKELSACYQERLDGEKLDKINEEEVVLGDNKIEPPHAGMVFASQEEVRDYYCKYALQEGFGIYRRSSRNDDDGKLKYFTLSCSRAGKRVSTSNSKSPWRQAPKTDCKAKLNGSIGSDGRVYVCHIILDHNHELSPGKIHSNRCKKSSGPRMKKRSEVKEQGITKVGQESHPVVEENTPLGENCQNLLANGDKDLLCSAANSMGENMSSFIKRAPPEISNNLQDASKHSLAREAVGLVKSGMVIGLGTERTSSLVIEELGKLIREEKLKDIVAVGANYQTRFVARQFGMTTVDLNDVNNIDIAFDGVDEVDFNKNLLKDGGAAHTVQKVVYSMADSCVILAEDNQVVHRLGSKSLVSVEVLPVAVSPVLKRLVALGGVPEIRSALRKDGPVITDLGNLIVDVGFPNGIQNPAELEKNINMIPGVVDNGIVSGVATSVLVAVRDGSNVNVMNLEEYVEVVIGWRYASTTS
ncbi:Ribose-5-phosphate isomerase a [Quillaja saponaria]|uniref:ribose-5-phosphate isomerase n=1 Tax=Quillaja saponaria TaxID=32244 RepID=A0AAD7Q821_QUISA|nr:Ribose-5-phosphate isomerase a [Quillaja saponaria]